MESNRVRIAMYHQTRMSEEPGLDLRMRATVSRVMAQGHTDLVKAVVAWCHKRLADPTVLTDTECEVFHQVMWGDPQAFDSTE